VAVDDLPLAILAAVDVRDALDTIEVGQPYFIRDKSGKVVLRDVGLIETSYVFDTLGDSTPGGVLLEEPKVVRVVGPHPGFEDTFDFCALADELIG